MSNSPQDSVTSASTDQWIKCISTQGTIRGVSIQATSLVQDLVTRHGLKDRAAVAMGEAAIGALLLASYAKQGERMNLNIQGAGYFKQALVDAHPEGTVRGYVVPRDITDETFQIVNGENTGPWGKGLLSVLRDRQEKSSQPYIGTVPLVTGHLAKDLTFYWLQSEQVPSAVGLAVNVEGGRVKAAGGFLVQAMPGAVSEEIRKIETQIKQIDSLSDEIANNRDPMHLLSKLFEDMVFMVVEEKELRFHCECTSERVERALILMGAQELQSLLDEKGRAQVTCEFCSKIYTMDGSDLTRLLSLLGTRKN